MPEPITLRYMRLGDIPAIADIEKHVFTMPWSRGAYAHEVAASQYSHMLIVERTPESRASGVAGWWARLRGDVPEPQILAYAGMWVFGEEAHISTIASAPGYRRQGWGELALLTLLLRAARLGAAYVALEVRVSNTPAQTLYAKYGFENCGIKRGYYHDNDEDAYDMRLRLRGNSVVEGWQPRLEAYAQQFPLDDRFTRQPRRVV